MSGSRERTLAALALAPGGSTAIRPDATPAPASPLPDNPWDAFGAKVESIQCRFRLASGPDELKSILAGIVTRHKATSAIAWEHPRLEREGLAAILREAGCELRDAAALQSQHERQCQGAACVDMGLTMADAALLHSGSVVVRALRGQERAASLLPPLHVALVEREALVADLFALAKRMRDWRGEDGLLPSAVHVITGPSATADIELIPVYGVHGPVSVEVVGLDY